ncbi:MAG: hypothetical protein O2782_09520 [bacterium]|nr:hypothetical protein [bacterium]
MALEIRAGRRVIGKNVCHGGGVRTRDRLCAQTTSLRADDEWRIDR